MSNLTLRRWEGGVGKLEGTVLGERAVRKRAVLIQMGTKIVMTRQVVARQ